MAIYSCNLASIGRTTHAAGTAGAHIRYIARPEASPALLCQHMPEDSVEARTFLDSAEREDRVNARVIDKIRIALPRELTEPQRAELVRAFMEDLTRNRVPWYGAIHQTGHDAPNRARQGPDGVVEAIARLESGTARHATRTRPGSCP